MELHINKMRKKERRIIRAACKIQINNLMKIIADEEHNTSFRCIMHGIDPTSMTNAIKEEIEVFQQVYNNPQSFLTLENDNISIIKHILNNFIRRKSLKDYKYLIWRKINLRDKFLYHAN